MNSILDSVGPKKDLLVSFRKSNKLTEVELTDDRGIHISFKRYPCLGRIFRNTLYEFGPPGLDQLARQGRKDPLYYGSHHENVEPDPNDMQFTDGFFLKAYPRTTEMGWIIGIVGVKKMNIFDGPRFLDEYSSPRRNSDFSCRRGNMFFKINDSFITVTDFDKRRAVFPEEDSLMRYQHFFRSYPLKPNKKPRQHWKWGENQYRYSLD